MGSFTITIDGKSISAEPGTTILDNARREDIYIPSICAHPQLTVARHAKGGVSVFHGDTEIVSDDPEATWDGCGLCMVEVDGQMVRACTTEVVPGLTVVTDTSRLISYRRDRLAEILRDHPHACLTCAQAEGCPRTQCSSNVPENERCCDLLGSCELQSVAQYVGVSDQIARYKPRELGKVTDDPLFDFNPELCIGCLRCVRACNDLRGVGGLSFVMRENRPVVGLTAKGGRAKSDCRFCGACVEVCPTGALTDKEKAVGQEREKTLVPCSVTCPAGIEIPRLLQFIANREPAKAAAVIREKVPLAYSVSYACFHPCEGKCRRGTVNEPVSVCRLKRFAVSLPESMADVRGDNGAPTGKTAAVIGSGPSGLTTSYYLARKGHTVTVFEAFEKPGGMLRTGIPRYRLPEEMLERDIGIVKETGVEIRCGSAVDATEFEKMTKEYDAVFIAAGAHESRQTDVPGADLEGIYQGVDFLRERALGKLPDDLFDEKRILVVGGGNAVFDAARVALRSGADKVDLVTRKSEQELFKWKEEVEAAKAEGVTVHTTWAPVEFSEENGSVTGLKVKRCTRIHDEGGGYHWKYDETETRQFIADAVIVAIGQLPSSEPFSACGRNNGGTIIVDPETLVTGIPNVFAGGDVASGARNIIEAVAMGRHAAKAIDRFLGGDGNIEEHFVESLQPSHFIGKIDGFADLGRNIPVIADPKARTASFEPEEMTFDMETAVAEASRCLCCDLRLNIAAADVAPRRESILRLTGEATAVLPDVEGVYQLLDSEKKVITIRGVMNLRQGLSDACGENGNAAYFTYEEEPMFTKRESELIQQYLQEHGELPGGGDDELDDLF